MNFSELKTVGIRGIGGTFAAPFRAFWKSHSRAVQFPFALIGSGTLGTVVNSLLVLHTQKRPSAIGGMALGMVVFVALFIGTYRRKVWSEWLICCRRFYSELALLGFFVLFQRLVGLNFFAACTFFFALCATCRLNVEKHSPEWLQWLLKICVLMALSLIIYCCWTIVPTLIYFITGWNWGGSEGGLLEALVLQLFSIPCFYIIWLGREATKIWMHNWKLALARFVVDLSIAAALVVFYLNLSCETRTDPLLSRFERVYYFSWVIGLWVLQCSRARFADVTESTLIWPLVWGSMSLIGLVQGGMALLLR